MADPVKIIEQEWGGKYYLRFESLHDSLMHITDIKSFSIIEDIDTASSVLSIKMIDGLGDLINRSYISPDSTYDLFIGKSSQDNDKSSFSLSVTEMQNMSVGKTENVAMDVNFISNTWNKLIKTTHSRSWNNKKYSYVVNKIAEEIGFDNIEVEETIGQFNIIQPDWTNFHMLKWISKNAINQNGIGGYEIGVKFNGDFFFKTIDTIKNNKPKKTFYMSAPKDGEEFFKNILIKQDYVPVLQQGGFGLDYYYFDYDTKKYINKKRKYSDSDEKQLSDWAFIATSHELADKRFYGGRDILTQNVVDSKISNVTNSVQKITIVVEGDVNLHIGDIVSLLIPNTEFSNEIVNENYSGYWMISRIAHQFQFDNNQFLSHISLSRAGINGVNKKGLVKTQTGKVLNK